MKNQQKSEFFLDKKEPKIDKTEQQEARRNIQMVGIVFINITYAVCAIFIGIYTQISSFTIYTGVALYAYGLIGGVSFHMLRKLYNQSELSHRMLIKILESSSIARIITDKNKKTIYTNNEFDLLSKSIKRTTFDQFMKFFKQPKKIQQKIDDMLLDAINNEVSTLEVSVDINNIKQHFKITSEPVTGWADYIHWRIENITERHQMRQAIHEKQEKLLDFTNNAPVGFFSVNENGEFLFINNTLALWLGMDSVKIKKNKKLHDFIDNVEKNTAAYNFFNVDDDLQNGEITIKRANGQIFKAAITHALVREANGKIKTRSVVYDLTSEIEMKEALKLSENRFQRLFEEAPIGICLLQSDHSLIECNSSFAETLNKPLDQITGKLLSSFVHDDDKVKLEDWLKNLPQNSTIFSSIEVVLQGDTEKTTQIYAQKSKYEDNMVLHFIDLTEQKSLEEQFTQSQKMQAIGQLAGGIAHDFNNLLTAMIGFCDLLLLRHKPGNPSFGDIMQIKQNANRAANLVRQLLAFSRQQTLQPRILDITDVLTEVSHLIRRLLGAGVDLKIEHGGDIGLIKVDQGQLEQVLVNLAVNARDAMDNSGKLRISTSNITNDNIKKLKGNDILPVGDWVAISVTDTGTGISEENISRIFDPFFTTKDVGAGTGLGLSTVHGIVHQTGGVISVDTEMGQGTTFTIYLPRHYEEDEDEIINKPVEIVTSSDLTGSAQILLVEDEDAVRTFSSRALTNKGYDVLDAHNGVAALDIIESKSPELELLITDVVMPEMDGPTMAKEVLRKYPHIKIIFMSGYAEDKFKEDLGEDVFFLPKPFTLKQLATKVKDVLDS